MKYLKLFESIYKFKTENELNGLIPELEELCQELKDKGGVKFDIIEGRLCRFEDGSSFISSDNSNKLSLIHLHIFKYYITCAIKDIIHELLFIESYSRDELKLDINYIKVEYTDHVDKGLEDYFNPHDIKYYHNIKSIPDLQYIYCITITFY